MTDDYNVNVSLFLRHSIAEREQDDERDKNPPATDLME